MARALLGGVRSKEELRHTDAQGRFWLVQPASLDHIHQAYAWYQSLYNIGYAQVRNRVMGLWLEAETYVELDYGMGWYAEDSEFAWATKIRPDYLLVVSDADGIERRLVTTPYAPSVICFWHTGDDIEGDRYAR